MNATVAVHDRPAPPIPVSKLVISYVVLLPLIFFAVRGSFSFQYEGINNGASGSYGSLVIANAGEGSRAHSAEMLLVYGIISLAILPIWKEVLKACEDNRLILALPLWAILSTFWSQEPKRTAAFAVLALINTLFGLYLSRRFHPEQQLELFLMIGAVLAVSSLLVVALHPAAGVDHKNATVGWQGVFPHKNICSLVMVSFLLPAVAGRFRGKGAPGKRALYIALMLALIIGTTSRTGWIVGLLSVSFILLLKLLQKLRPIERVLTLILVTVLAAVAIWAVGFYLTEILALLGKDSTMSGRTVIWASVFQSIFKQPFRGFGYDAFWIGFKGEAVNLALATGYAGLSNAENGVLQLWLELGLVGVVILLALLLRTCKNAVAGFTNGSPNYVIWYISLLFLTLLALVDGDKFMVPHEIEWTMFVLADAGLALEAKRVLAKPTS